MSTTPEETTNHERPATPTDFKRVEVDRNAAVPHYDQQSGQLGWMARDTALLGRDRKLIKYLAREVHTATGETIKAEDRIFGELSRSFPAEVMQKVYTQFIDWAHNLALEPHEKDPQYSQQNLMFVMSGPGIGKTYLPKVIARAFGYKPLMIGAGEGSSNIDELVVEYVYETADKRGEIPFHEITGRINNELRRLATNEADGKDLPTHRKLLDSLNNTPHLLKEHVDTIGDVTGKIGQTFYTLDSMTLSGRGEIVKLRAELAKMQMADTGYTKKQRDLYVLTTPSPSSNKPGPHGEAPLTPDEKKRREAKEREFEESHKEIVSNVLGPIIEQNEQILGAQGIVHQGGGAGIRQKNGRVLEELIRVSNECTQYGRAVPTIITIDEFNRFTNFGKKLQNFWEVVGGSSKENVEIMDADGVTKHVFTPEMLKYVFVYLTGNDPKKVPQANELDESMMSRLGDHAIRLDDFDAKDWQHRFEQVLTGMGLGVHFRADEDYFHGNPTEFMKHIRTKRVEGLSRYELAAYTGSNLDKLPMSARLIGYGQDPGNAYHVMTGLRQVGEFMEEWANIYKEGGAVARELSQGSSMRLSIDPRLVTYIINDIRKSKVTAQSGADQRAGVRGGTSTIVKPENLGDKLVDKLVKMVTDAHPEGSLVRTKLAQSMWKHGLIDEKQFGDLTGLGKGEQKRVAEIGDLRKQAASVQQVRKLLNTNPHKKYHELLEPMRKIICEIAAETIEGINVATADTLLTPDQMEAFIEQVAAHEAELAKDLDGEGKIGGGKLPPTLSRILLPTVFKDKGYKIDIVPTVLVDGVTRVEQLGSDKAGKAIASGIAAAKGKDETLATSKQILAGLGWPELTAATRHEQIMHLFMSGTGKSVEAALAGARLKAAETDLAKAETKQKPAAQARMDGARRTTQTEVVAALAQDSESSNRTDWFADAELMAEHGHKSGLAATVIHTANNKSIKGGHDALSVITVSYDNPNKGKEGEPDKRDRTLIVGFGEQSADMVKMLANASITYIHAGATGAQEEIAKQLGAIVGIAQDNLRKEDDKHPDKAETAGSGLLFHLEQALNIRTPDSFDGKREQAKTDGGKADLLTRRLNAVAEHLTDERNLPTQAKVNPVHATRLSYTDQLKMKQAEKPVHEHWQQVK